MQALINSGRVKWVHSQELETALIESCCKTTKSLAQEGIDWKLDGDLHDEVIIKLEKSLKLPELLQSYRRARIEKMVQGNKIKGIPTQSQSQ